MKNALLISVQGIGNTVLMTPVIRSLAEAGYEVDALVSDNGSDEILARNANANKQYLWIENEGLIKNVLRLRSELRRVQYDVAYALYPNGKRENFLLYLSRASWKIRYVDSEHCYRLLNFLPASKKVTFERRHDVESN